MKDISRSFPGVQALDKVSFDVKAGSVHALVGANGAGKSTLMKILAGALPANSGSIVLDGVEYSPANPNQAIQAGVSTIYQELNLLSDRTVVQNMTLGHEPARSGVLKKRQARKLTLDVLKRLRADYISPDSVVSRLKVGEKQLVEIGKALLTQCKVLIMDEPTAALNKSESDALFENIQQLKQNGVTILYVSHRLAEIFQIADVVTILRDGKHVLTESIQNVTPESVITAMIGRKLEGIYPPRNNVLGEKVLDVSGLTSEKTFQNISFSVKAGEVVAITGLTGSGKTELCKAIFGDFPIDSGTVKFFDRKEIPNPTKAVANRVGYMPEDRKKEGVLEEVSIRRNISLAYLANLANPVGWINKKRESAAAMQQVNDLQIKTPNITQLVRNLSGGNQQKVSLAKWLAAGSRVLILMEPTQGIDVGVKFEIYQLIADLSSKGVGILLVSSEISEILGMAHRILVMHNGDLCANLDGTTTDTEEILFFTFGQKRS
ncbi:MAG TPA: sugar ABC transporter ATP-binding protein [Longilinea sp.]|nr:sugar ABC transporter ATP-binding protein [Longilinea sp.]